MNSIAKSWVLSRAPFFHPGPLDFLFAVMVGHPDDKPKTVGSFLGAKQTESGVEATTPLMILANTPWHLK
jgi:hypothetical protein